MVDISTTISVDVFCSDCGGALEAVYESLRSEINVDHCDDCFQNKYNEGVTDGSDAAE